MIAAIIVFLIITLPVALVGGGFGRVFGSNGTSSGFKGAGVAILAMLLCMLAGSVFLVWSIATMQPWIMNAFSDTLGLFVGSANDVLHG